MASNVDLPQPDGPAIDRYSPFWTSKCTAERACVSTSSVTKTLLTFSKRLSGCEPLSIVISLLYETGRILVQFDAVVIIVRGHIGQDHPVSYLQSFLDLDRTYRAAAERYLHRIGILAVRIDLEEPHRAVLLPEDRTPHIYHIIQFFQLDRPVHAQVRPPYRGQLAAQRDVHCNRDRKSVVQGKSGE